MDELSRDARTLIDRANVEERPAPGVSERARKNLAAAIAAGAATTGASATAATVSKAGLSVGVKLALVTVVAGGVGTGTWLLTDRERVPQNDKPPVEAIAPEISLPPDEPLDDTTPDPPRAVRPAKQRAKRPPVLTPEALARETDLLERAQLALNAGEPARALTHLDRHAQEFPRGTLRRERIAARVFALCELGQVGRARQQGGRFLREFPDGPLAERVRSSCGGPVE